MTKSTSKARSKTSVKVAGATIKATPVRRKKVAPVSQDSVTETTPVVEVAAPVTEVPVVETPVVETTPVVEASVAPKAEAVFAIPDLGKGDLVMSPQGFHQLPGKTWYSLSRKFGKDPVRQAIAAMVGLNIRLEAAMELVTWPAFRPYMVGQLAAVQANQDVLIVLEWVWGQGEGWSWKEAYTAFPRAGFPGCKATRQEIGKLNKLVGLMDALRKEGKTSIRNVDLLAQACHLLGWIK